MNRILVLAALMLTAASGSASANAEFRPGLPGTHLTCGVAMSCSDPRTWHSEAPLRMSIAAGPEAPSACVKDILGDLRTEDVPVCESFAADHAGTARQRAIAYLNLGHFYFYREDGMRFDMPTHAFATWDKAIATDPSFGEPFVAKAEVLRYKGDKTGALTLFNKALSLEPGNWRAILGLARLQAQDRNWDEAIRLAAAAVRLAPGHGVAHQIYAGILEDAGRIEDARREYNKATIDYDPGVFHRLPGVMQETPPWKALAAFEVRQNRPQQAIDAISKLIGDGPESEFDGYEIYSFRAKQYEALGDIDKAVADYEHAARLLTGTEDAESFRARAAMLRATLGNTAEAGDTFREIIHTGKLRSILRIQVFLRNQGFDEVAIDGKPGPALERALERCLSDKTCSVALGQPI